MIRDLNSLDQSLPTRTVVCPSLKKARAAVGETIMQTRGRVLRSYRQSHLRV